MENVGRTGARITRERISDELGATARSLVRGLLEWDPRERLGSVGGAAEVRAHAFFVGVDWAALLRLEMPPPLRTSLSRPGATIH